MHREANAIGNDPGMNTTYPGTAQYGLGVVNHLNPGGYGQAGALGIGAPIDTLVAAQTPRILVTTSTLTAPQPGTVWQFLQLLESAGINPKDFLEQHKNEDMADLGSLLQYLRVAVLNGEPSVAKLAFHLDLANAMPPGDYDKWRKLMQELRHKSKLSGAVLDFVEKKEVGELLHRKLLRRLGMERLAEPVPRKHKEAYLRSMIKFLEQWESLVTDDPNLRLIFQFINRYGGILPYYAQDYVPRKAILRMVELGFDVDYLVFGQDEIHSVGPTNLEEPDKWGAKLQQVIKEVVGSREREPEIELGLDRHKFFHQIKEDYDRLVKEEDKGAALRLISQLQPLLEHRRDTLLRAGDITSHEKVSRYSHELQYLHKLLTGELERLPGLYRMRAVRSTKLVPELLFDNTRLACCLFKPSGLFHGELSLLLLDPTTPMIEFWLDPYPEFLGLATLYAGLNAQGQRVIFIDTMEYDDRLLDMSGYNGAMRFMLQAAVLDAYRARAKKLVVFAAPYGKPVGFANYVRLAAAKGSSITYHESYFFESVDPEDTALSNSLLLKHHYTAAFGYNTPMKGVIDFGFNLVGVGVVSKLLTGGRGVYEIDVAAFLKENGLWSGEAAAAASPPAAGYAAAVPPPGSLEGDAAVHRLPEHHDIEIRRREERALKRGLKKLRKALRRPTLELTPRADDELIQKLMQVERSGFNAELRYDASHFTERLKQRNAELMLLRDDGKLVGFALSYVSPIITGDGIYLDDLVLVPELQSKGIGSILLDVFVELSSVRGYEGIYVLAELGAASIPLIKFYQRAGFQFMGTYADLGNLLYKPLWIAGPENAEALGVILQKLRDKLKQSLTNPKVSFYSNLDPQLITVLQNLEAVFPEHLRYSEAQFRQRMSYPDSYILVIYEQNEPVAYNITCHDPALPKHTILLDSISVKPEFQKRGIGTLMLNTQFAIPTLTHYTRAVFFCQGQNQDGVNLLDYYKRRFGAVVVSGSERDNSYRMMADVSIASTDPAQTGEVVISSPGQYPFTEGSAAEAAAPRPEAPASTAEPPAEVGGAGSGPEEGDEGTHDRDEEDAGNLSFVGDAMAERLAASGVDTPRELLKRASMREQRTQLAKDSGVRADHLFSAVNLAELVRAGVPHEHLATLKRHGIKSLNDLRAVPAGRLREIIPAEIPDDALASWQRRAKRLKSNVEA